MNKKQFWIFQIDFIKYRMEKIFIANALTGEMLFGDISQEIEVLAINVSLSSLKTQKQQPNLVSSCYQLWLIFVNLQQFSQEQETFHIFSNYKTIIFINRNNILLIAQFNIQSANKQLAFQPGFEFSEKESNIQYTSFLDELGSKILDNFYQSFSQSLSKQLIYKKRYEKFQFLLKSIVTGFINEKLVGTKLLQLKDCEKKYFQIINQINKGTKIILNFSKEQAKNICLESIGDEIYCFQQFEEAEKLAILRKSVIKSD